VVAGGPLTRLLDLGVSSGSLTGLSPGQIAVSTLEGSSGALNVHVGSRVHVYLPDGTPYRATVSALYSRSLASGDLLIPAAVAAGHTGTAPGFGQLLVSGATPAALTALVAGHPGAHLASRAVANAQAVQSAAQGSFGNNLILGVIATLAAVSLVNTLVVATLERRRALRLLGRVGATRGQAAAVSGWQALFVIVTGLAAGAAAGTATMLAATRAITGSWTPFIQFAPAALIAGGVAALTIGAIMIPFRFMSRALA
jgi:putative ABC transport system permease protein